MLKIASKYTKLVLYMALEYLKQAMLPNGKVIKLNDLVTFKADGPNNATGSWEYYEWRERVRSIFKSEDRIYVSDHNNATTGYYLSSIEL